MFNIFNKPSTESIFQILKVDMHSHLLPNVDDGCKDMTSSLTLIKKLENLGYQKLIITPHIHDLYPNSKEGILRSFTELSNELNINKINIAIDVAAEYLLDSHFENLLLENEILYFGKDEKYVLFEFSFISPPINYKEIIFNMVLMGYTPVLAHPERYTFLMDNNERLNYLLMMGCKMQVNISSLLGFYGKRIETFAFKLINQGNIDFLSMDIHNERQFNFYLENKNNKKVLQILNKFEFMNKQLL